MAEYKERQITATAHQRVRAVTILLKRQAAPRVVFQEEEVQVFADQRVIERDVSYCEADLNPAGGTIALRNPNTGALTGGTITHAQLYAAIYSLYLEVAQARDDALEAA